MWLDTEFNVCHDGHQARRNRKGKKVKKGKEWRKKIHKKIEGGYEMILEMKIRVNQFKNERKKYLDKQLGREFKAEEN